MLGELNSQLVGTLAVNKQTSQLAIDYTSFKPPFAAKAIQLVSQGPVDAQK